jgi:hypothetical protein
MPTSTNPDWFQTAGELCASAAYELGAVGMGDSLEDSEEAEMITRLNGMLAKWSTDMNMFRDVSATITIAGGVGAATLPSEVQNIRSVRHNVSATYKRLMVQWNRDQYFGLPNRTQAGSSPIVYYVSPGVEGDVIYVWPVPATDTDFDIDYGRSFYFAEGPEQTLDLPKEWYEAALYGLAARSANIFGATRLDPNAVARVDTQSRVTYQALLDGDRPDSYYMYWDSPVEVY